MTKKMIILFMGFVLGRGWTLFDRGTAQSWAIEKGVPIIVRSFASKALRVGDVWKVFLKASEPEGKMRYIFATISQPG